MSLRGSLVGVALLGLAALPLAALATAGVGADALLGAAFEGFLAALDAVGWVLGVALTVVMVTSGWGVAAILRSAKSATSPGRRLLP